MSDAKQSKLLTLLEWLAAPAKINRFYLGVIFAAYTGLLVKVVWPGV